MARFKAQTPSTYKSPLAAGIDFYFVSPHTIYPEFYNMNVASNTENRFYMTVTDQNGTVIGETKYVVVYFTPSGNVVVKEGKDEGITVKLQSGTYVIKYEFEYQITVNGVYEKDTVTYTFKVVQNQYPPKKFTVKDTVERILRLVEPLVWDRNKGEYVKPPRFKFAYKYPSDTADGKAERALFNQTSPEFTFTRCTLLEQLKLVGDYIHAEPRLLDDMETFIFDRYGEQDLATYTPEYVGQVKKLMREANTIPAQMKLFKYLDELIAKGGHAKEFAEKVRNGLREQLRGRIAAEEQVIAKDDPEFAEALAFADGAIIDSNPSTVEPTPVEPVEE